MDHGGMDVHKKESQLSILTDGVEDIERRVRTEPERFAAVLGTGSRFRILIEASAVMQFDLADSRLDDAGLIGIAVLLDLGAIASHMQEAYRRVQPQDTADGCFMAGPSRTADIVPRAW
jgi:hypothetical protein